MSSAFRAFSAGDMAIILRSFRSELGNFCTHVESSIVSAAADPAAAHLHVAALDRRPGDAICAFLLPRIADMGREGMVELLAVDILGVRRKIATAQEQGVRCWKDTA